MELDQSDSEAEVSYQDKSISEASIILDTSCQIIPTPRKKRLPINSQQALKRYQKQVIGVLFDAWHEYARSSIAKYKKETQSRAHNRKRQLKRVIRTHKRLPNHQAVQLYTQHLKFKALNSLYQNTLNSRDKKFDYDIAQKCYNKSLFRKTIDGLKYDSREYYVYLEKAMRCDYSLTCRRYFTKWLDFYRTRLIKNYKNVRANMLRSKLLEAKAIQAWRNIHYEIQIKRFKYRKATEHYRSIKIVCAFKGMKFYRSLRWVRYQQYCSAIKHWSFSYYKKAIISWKKFTGIRLVKKQMLETAVEERRDDLRKDAMILWMEISLKWNKQREDRIIRDKLNKDEKVWKVVSRCAKKWMSMSIRKTGLGRRKIHQEPQIREIRTQKRITERVRNLESDIVAEACIPKKRLAPRRLPRNFLADSNNSEFKHPIPNIKQPARPSEDFLIDSIFSQSHKPTLKPTDFATPLKPSHPQPKLSPVSSIGFDFLQPTPQKTLPSSEFDIYKRISEIEVELLNFKHEKNKFQEFNEKLRENPYNEILSKQAACLKDKISCEVPRIRELFSEIQYLKNMSSI